MPTEEIDLEQIEGVGRATAEKLRESGYTDIMSIAVASPMELADVADIGVAIAQKIISSARKLANVGGFETADVLLERRKKVGKLTSSSKNFDELLGGGFETQAITELYGEFGSGKTQIVHQLCVNVQLPSEKKGLEGHAAVIDTENTFRPERIRQMAAALDMDETETLAKIHVARAFNSNHQMLLVDKITELGKEVPLRLIIVDSLTAHFRAEYLGRGSLAERQQQINKHMHELLKLGDVLNAVIVCTNQVSARPDMFMGDPTRPIGGHVVAHTSTYRLYLRKSKANKRIARLIDSPCLPEGEAVFSLNEDGIRD